MKGHELLSAFWVSQFFTKDTEICTEFHDAMVLRRL